MNREAIEASIDAYQSMQAHIKAMIEYYEFELRKIDFAEDLQEDKD